MHSAQTEIYKLNYMQTHNAHYMQTHNAQIYTKNWVLFNIAKIKLIFI